MCSFAEMFFFFFFAITVTVQKGAIRTGQLGPGPLALGKRVASSRAGALSKLRLLCRQSGQWRRFWWLLCWRRSGTTGGHCRAGTFRQEVSHSLG